jgi:hypothetical protein
MSQVALEAWRLYVLAAFSYFVIIPGQAFLPEVVGAEKNPS